MPCRLPLQAVFHSPKLQMIRIGLRFSRDGFRCAREIPRGSDSDLRGHRLLSSHIHVHEQLRPSLNTLPFVLFEPIPCCHLIMLCNPLDGISGSCSVFAVLSQFSRRVYCPAVSDRAGFRSSSKAVTVTEPAASALQPEVTRSVAKSLRFCDFSYILSSFSRFFWLRIFWDL